jgi:hypothetical protein
VPVTAGLLSAVVVVRVSKYSLSLVRKSPETSLLGAFLFLKSLAVETCPLYPAPCLTPGKLLLI